MQSKPNIIFIVMDALRARNLGCYNYNRPTSPNIDELAKEGLRFTNAFSSNNATEKSFLAILSGRHILLNHSKKQLLLSKDELNLFFNSGGILLQEILKKEGYKTYCLNELHGWQQKGFDFFYNPGEIIKTDKSNLDKVKIALREVGRKIVYQIPSINISNWIKAKYGRNNGQKATSDAINIIKEASKKKENFFLYIYYNDTHIPYNPKKFYNKFKGIKKEKGFTREVSRENYNPMLLKFWRGAFNKKESIKDIIAKYDNCVAYDDFLIGQVLAELKKEKLDKKTIVVLFSDHGESLNEHGIFFDHHGLYDVSTNFPLIIKGPNIENGKNSDKFIQHEDFVPTILDLLNIKYEKNNFDGMNLFSTEKRSFVFMEEGDKENKIAIRTKEYKYIESISEEKAKCTYCNKIHGGLIELYDLKKDPEEKNNIALANLKIVNEMKKIMYEHIRKLKMTNESRRIKKLFKKPNLS